MPNTPAPPKASHRAGECLRAAVPLNQVSSIACKFVCCYTVEFNPAVLLHGIHDGDIRGEPL